MPDPLITAMRQLQQRVGGIVAVEVDGRASLIIRWFGPQAKRAASKAVDLARVEVDAVAMGRAFEDLAGEVGRARGSEDKK